MTCDDKNNPSSEGFPPKRDLKRQLDSNEDQVSEKRLKTLLTDSKTLKTTSALVQDIDENETKFTEKTKIAVTKHSRRRKKRLEIETEFKILQSLIPKIANKQTINELEIIDACVNYIEALQEQLNIRNPEEHNTTTDDTENDENTISTSIRSLMSAIAEDQVEDSLPSVQDDEMDDYLNSASSEEDFTDDEADEDSNNNNNNETTSTKDMIHAEGKEKRSPDSSKDSDVASYDHREDLANQHTSSST